MNRFWDQCLRPIAVAARPRCLVEVGVDSGLLTEKVLEYCASAGAVLHAVDPRPQLDIDEWRARHADRLVFHQAPSLDVLGRIHDVDVAFLDGDHNWFTVFHELKLLEDTALKDRSLPPLIALHDVDWPYGRRDLYYDPDSIPDAYRHPHRRLGLVPGEADLIDDGMNSELENAIPENSPRNGVRTALEDFVAASHLEWRLFFVPGFHGLGLAVTDNRLAESEELQRAIKSLETAPFLTRWAQVIELARNNAELATHRWQSEHMTIRNDLTEERDQLSKLLVDAETRLSCVPDLELRIANLARDVKEARGAALEQARVLDERLTMSAQVLSDVMNSPSWRLTKPLRTAKHFLLGR